MSRFTRPETHTISISKGDTLTVRKRISAGERRAQYARMYRVDAAGQLQREPVMGRVSLVVAYLLDWSLVDDEGKQVVIRELAPEDLIRVLDNLDPTDFDEIHDAIEAHDNAMRAERAAQKKTDGAPTSSATSSSPSGVAGDTSGSSS